MNEKAKGLARHLSASFDSCPVHYEFANELHRFRIEWGPTHWLYVTRAFVDDHTEQDLHQSLERWRIADTLRSSQRSRCLLLGARGVLEVNSSYGRRPTERRNGG